MKELTKQEQIVLDAIKAFIKEHEYSPSYQELTEITPFRSKATISWHLDMLRVKGYITFKSGGARTIKVVETKKDNWEELKVWLEQYVVLLKYGTEGLEEEVMIELLEEIIEKMQEMEQGKDE